MWESNKKKRKVLDRKEKKIGGRKNIVFVQCFDWKKNARDL